MARKLSGKSFLTSLFPAQSLLRSQLRAGLSQLPAPKNDFEIVVPDLEEMEGGEVEEAKYGYVEDAAEVEERAAALKREEGGRAGKEGWGGARLPTVTVSVVPLGI